MLDHSFIASLPNDPEAAWPLYEAHVRQQFQKRDYNGEEYLDKEKYVCCLIAFAELYDIGLQLEDPSTMSGRQFDEFYNTAEKRIVIFTAKMALKTAKRLGLYSLDPALKTEVHHYIGLIREIISKAELRPNKKEDLFDRLNQLAKEVDKDRTRAEVWTSIYVAVKAEIKDGVTILEPALKPLEKIADAFSKAKETIDLFLPKPEAKLRIEGPKTQSNADDFEDEIPF